MLYRALLSLLIVAAAASTPAHRAIQPDLEMNNL